MLLEIITPDEHVFSGEVSEVTVQGTLGSFQVLSGHAPIISTLSAGDIRYKSAEGEKTVGAEGGVVEVLNNKIIVLVERVYHKDEN
jgi:F-type H+-transporting ATPase subunit epsilon